MGVDHVGDGGTSNPRIWIRRDTNANVPLTFCHIGTKRSVLWPSKYANFFGWGSTLDPAGRAHDAPVDPLIGWGGYTHPHTPLHSAPTHLWLSPCVSQNSRQIYAYGQWARLQCGSASMADHMGICLAMQFTIYAN